MKQRIVSALFFIALFLPAVASAQLERSPSAEGTTVYIIAPQDGSTVSGEVTVQFGVRGMGIAPAGIDFPNTGHHHLLIDVSEMPSFEMPIPADEHHVHFGKGQTETTLSLEPGRHTLQLIFADRNHVPHDPPVVSEKITIVVK